MQEPASDSVKDDVDAVESASSPSVDAECLAFSSFTPSFLRGSLRVDEIGENDGGENGDGNLGGKGDAVALESEGEIPKRCKNLDLIRDASADDLHRFVCRGDNGILLYLRLLESC